MTREEAIENLQRLQNLLSNDPYINTQTIITTCNVAIEALKQEPCDDAISRQAALDAIDDIDKTACMNEYHAIVKAIEDLPSVTPQEPNNYGDCDTCLNKYTNKCNNCMSAEYQGKRVGFPTNYKEPCEDAIKKAADVKALDTVIKAMKWTPKQRTGHWIMPVNDDGMGDPYEYQVRCSKCGFDLDPQTWDLELHQYGADKYCPKCGAKMESEEQA